MVSSVEPKLPPELEHEIFLLAATDRSLCCTVSRVCRRAKEWLDPPLYDSICIQDSPERLDRLLFARPSQVTRFTRTLILNVGEIPPSTSTLLVSLFAPKLQNLAYFHSGLDHDVSFISSLGDFCALRTFRLALPPGMPPVLSFALPPTLEIAHVPFTLVKNFPLLPSLKLVLWDRFCPIDTLRRLMDETTTKVVIKYPKIEMHNVEMHLSIGRIGIGLGKRVELVDFNYLDEWEKDFMKYVSGEEGMWDVASCG